MGCFELFVPSAGGLTPNSSFLLIDKTPWKFQFTQHAGLQETIITYWCVVYVMGDTGEGYIGKFLKKADTAMHDGVKKADDLLAEAVDVGTISAKEASKTGKKLGQQALKENTKIRKKAQKALESGMRSARNVGHDSMTDLALIERLGELKEKGMITDREFQTAKKKLLDKI